MTLFFSFFVYISLFLFAFRIIMPYCYSQFMMINYFGYKRSSVAAAPSKCGLGLIITKEAPRVANVIESSTVVRPPPTATEKAVSTTKKKDPGGIGFIDDMGGGVDGLMSCTESLGFESCDERRVDDDHDRHDVVDHGEHGNGNGDDHQWRRRRSEEKRERNNKKFPPPLSSLNQNGQPCFYLKPVRKNGRLELTEVRIQRPEILRAVRQNGRLRLHLVSSHPFCPKINEEEEEEEIENNYEEIKQEEQEEELHLQEEEEEEVEELWNYRVSGDGLRRCHELVHHDHHDYHRHHHHISNINEHHHGLHVWRQPCVITRDVWKKRRGLQDNKVVDVS